jgi:hypothetical protein
MRSLLHVSSFALMLPGLILASAFVLFGHAIAGGTLIEFFSRLLFHAAWLVSGGFLAAGALLGAIHIGGFGVRTREIAAACVAILSGASLIALIALGSEPFSAGRDLFLLPGLAALGGSAWLALKEWPRPTRISSLGSA